MNKQSIIHSLSMGDLCDRLCMANIKNWEGKEKFYNPDISIQAANNGVINSFQSNKIRNLIITRINQLFHNAPIFHFRNYHNY